LDTSPHNLPVELTSFVGRQAEIAETSALLDDARLVTLTGSGGCGKTRLALRVAAERLDHYPDGVWMVELASVRDPLLVPKAIAEALSIKERSGAGALDALVGGIGAKHLLAVVDNCEHLVRNVAEVIEVLLRYCPALSVLTTSREPLGVPGEVTSRVPSLAFPDETVRAPATSVDSYEAVQLFVERAARARPRFSLDEENTASVAQICRRLDGLPLAIELAAARVRVLTPAQISAGLHDRFRLLTGGARTAVPRQQTLEASVEWSHDLMLEAERVLLRRLSVFIGGFTLEAAEGVCPGDSLDAQHVLDLLSHLADKSLVFVDEEGASGRFHLLETVRQFAARRLQEAGESSATRTRHYEFFLAFAQYRKGESEDAYRRRIRADYDNLRRALAWAAEEDDPDLLLQLTRRLALFWFASTYLVEACQWVRAAIDRGAAAEAAVRARALGTLAQLALLAEDIPTAETAATEGLELLRASGDKRAMVATLTTLGFIGIQLGDSEAGRRHTKEAATLAEELGDQQGLAYALAIQGSTALIHPADRDVARAVLARSIDVARGCGAQHMERVAQGTLGILAQFDGRLREAVALFGEALPGLREVGDGYVLSLVLVNVVNTLGLLGNFGDADAACQELASIAEKMGAAELEFSAAADGWLAFCQGDWQHAIHRYRAQPGFTPVSLRGMRVARLAWSELLGGEREAARKRLDEFLEKTDPARTCLAQPLTVRALVARDEGDLEGAEGLAYQALTAAPDDPCDWLATWMSLAALAAVETDLECCELATRLWAALDAAARKTGMVPFPAATGLMRPATRANRDELGDQRYDHAWAEGAALSVEEAANYASRGRGQRRRPALGWASLTPTEREVIKLVVNGFSNPDIAARMFVSPPTVKTHLTNIFRKLGVSSRSELAAEAVRRGPTSTERTPQLRGSASRQP
jgi:predicted ATPase/DNA-binding CsgD family transcriptional regulator